MSIKDKQEETFSEAIFELRWGSQKLGVEQIPPDPDYKILLGKILESLKKKDYPHFEALPNSKVPEDLSRGIVHYRFRKTPGKFPLVQIGPGVFTVNQDIHYKWSEFRELIVGALKHLYSNHPNINNLTDIKIVLTFVNGIKFDFGKQDIREYLRKNFNLDLSINSKLLKQSTFEQKPKYLDLNILIGSSNPKGDFNLLIGPGKKEGEDALVWHTTFRTQLAKLPRIPEDIQAWLEGANEILTTWI